MTAIYMSLRPQWAELVASREKNHEFRKKLPAQPFSKWFIYVTVPFGQLQYVATVGTPIARPNTIGVSGYENEWFNNYPESYHAIPILGLSELYRPISLGELRREFGFKPPQFFAYDKKYEALTQKIREAPKRKIF